MSTWLITGATSGLGLALTEFTLSQGCKVIAAARNVSKLPSSVSAAIPLELDMSWSHDQITDTATKVVQEHGPIHVLASVAGVGCSGFLEELEFDKILEIFQVNVHGPLSLVKAILPSLREQQSGHILMVSSPAGTTNRASLGAYNASKAALDSFTETLAAELTSWNLKVHLIEPGFFYTPFLGRAMKDKAPSIAAYTSPMRLDGYLAARLEQGKIGDPVKFAERMWDIVQGSGPARDLNSKVVRIPVGADSSTVMADKFNLLMESIGLTEGMWNSTDMSSEQIEEIKRQISGS